MQKMKLEEMDYTVLHYQKLSERAFTPERATPFSIGLDLKSPIDVVIPRRWQMCVPTDLAFAIPLGYYGRLASKSGLVIHHGVTTEAGVIDPDYRGNCMVVLRTTDRAYRVEIGAPIAQLILERATIPELIEAPVLCETVRGAAGFGSSYARQCTRSRLYQRTTNTGRPRMDQTTHYGLRAPPAKTSGIPNWTLPKPNQFTLPPPVWRQVTPQLPSTQPQHSGVRDTTPDRLVPDSS